MNYTNKLTKILMVATLAIGLFMSNFCVAADTSVQSQEVFKAKEFGISLASAYAVGTAGTLKGSPLFTKPYTLNFNAGLFYYPWRYVGIEANVPFYQTKGVSVDEVQSGLLFRLPLAKTLPVLKNIAPYVGLGGVYNWQTAQNWAYVGKVGTELRLNANWGVFVEGQYRNNQFNHWGSGIVSFEGGLHLLF